MRALMRPLVRFCVRNAHSVQDFYNLAKSVFLSVAQEEMLKSTRKVNVSRLAALTGLHRDEVSKLLSKEGQYEPAPRSILDRVIGQWRHDKRFRTKAGEPRVLSFGEENSEFDELVGSVSKGLYSGTVLFELKRSGAVEETARGLRLVQQMFSVAGDPKQGFSLLSEDIDSLMCAGEENLTRPDEIPNLHIRTDYDNIVVEAVPEIKRWLVDEGKSFHKRAREFLASFDKDINPQLADKAGGVRVALTAFSHAILPAGAAAGSDDEEDEAA